jgi:enediyne biosynthesis thioesterase
MPASYIYRHRVTFDETNLVGNVYFAHYLHWQGQCREHFLADHAPGVLGELNAGLALATVSCSAEFYTESTAFDQVEVHMTLERISGNRIFMGFDYLRTREPAGEPAAVLLARGRQTVACMRRASHGLDPASVPAELRHALSRFTRTGHGVPA